MSSKVKVNLINSPEHVIDMIYTACRTCSSIEEPYSIWSKDHNENSLKLIKKVIEAGHLSVLRHVHFIFTVSGISRACSHQLVRSQVGANFSQQSQRYCKEESFDYIIPELIENHPEHAKSYHNLMTQIQSLYNNMLADGIPAEDARFILPNACVTAFTVSYNLEALIHLANVRLCSRAQWEIRRLVKLMCEEVIKIEPWLAEYFVPKCKKDGHCKEINCCGLMPKESKTK